MGMPRITHGTFARSSVLSALLDGGDATVDVSNDIRIKLRLTIIGVPSAATAVIVLKFPFPVWLRKFTLVYPVAKRVLFRLCKPRFERKSEPEIPNLPQLPFEIALVSK